MPRSAAEPVRRRRRTRHATHRPRSVRTRRQERRALQELTAEQRALDSAMLDRRRTRSTRRSAPASRADAIAALAAARSAKPRRARQRLVDRASRARARIDALADGLVRDRDPGSARRGDGRRTADRAAADAARDALLPAGPADERCASASIPTISTPSSTRRRRPTRSAEAGVGLLDARASQRRRRSRAHRARSRAQRTAAAVRRGCCAS